MFLSLSFKSPFSLWLSVVGQVRVCAVVAEVKQKAIQPNHHSKQFNFGSITGRVREVYVSHDRNAVTDRTEKTGTDRGWRGRDKHGGVALIGASKHELLNE